MASYNLIDTKYRQMAFRSLSNDTPISPYEKSFGTPGQTKVSGDQQRETTHDFCYLAVEWWGGGKKVIKYYFLLMSK